MTKPFTFLKNTFLTNLFSVSIFLILTMPANAQNINNATNFFIPAEMQIRTEGSLLNTGFFQNNGSFALSGNFVNAFVYQGTGAIMLTGFNQIINSNDQGISHLIIDGGGTKTLVGLLTITAEVDFNDGIVLVNNADTLILDENCIVNSGSATSYVDGALVVTGNGFKYLPIGKNGKYHPVTLEELNGITPVQQLEVFENLPTIETEIPTLVKQDIYWERKTIAGFFERSPISFGYNLDNTNLERLVILEGETPDGIFTVSDSVRINTSATPNMISSARFLTKNYFVLGETIMDPPKKYYLSTTLSPNANDPENRSVKIFGDNITPMDFSFKVFNRWGLLIYESSSYERMKNQGWDGVQNGSVLPSGVYPYNVKYVDTAGRLSQQSGFITIIH